jgi:hypothetical protein
MTAGLLERDAELRRLRETLRGAVQGRGSAVLVSGEAGIGKTSLVRAFAQEASGAARVLVGTCDDLVTPRTLGPFRDMAHDTGGPLAEAVDRVAGRDAVFGAVHQKLAGRPTVMIVEDVHWADDATLDVLRYLAWRIPSLPGVLVLTYRDDELGDIHPLRRVLGALTSSEVRRLALQPLSPSAVEELSGGRELQPGPGTRVEVRPGVAHEFWNAGEEEVRLVVEVRPGERLEQLIRQLFLAAQDGRTDAKGRPRPLHAAVLARGFADTIRFTSPPRLVQRALSGLLTPVARAAGRRAIDPDYACRHLPVVDLEPLPAEVAALVPGLAGQHTRSTA